MPSSKRSTKAKARRRSSPSGAYAPVAAVVRRGRRFLVTGHQNPEGDALGSTLGLVLGLRSLGKEAVAYNGDGVPHLLRFLPGAEGVVRTIPEGRWDALFVVDSGDPALLSEEMRSLIARRDFPLVVLDHHLTNVKYGDVNVVETRAAATGELVTRVLGALGVKLDRAMALNLLAAVVVDTGGFRYSNTTPETLRAAAELVAAGADPWAISQALQERQREGRIRLIGEALRSLELDPTGRIASIRILAEDFRRTGTNKEDTEDIINFPRSIEGVEVAVLFRQEGPRDFKVSFRSRGTVNVAAVAESFGGGGHHNASGCRLEGNLEEVRRRILEATTRAAAKALPSPR